MGYSPPGSSVHVDSPGRNTGVGCYAFLQVIFPTQGSNPGLPHCRWILYCLSHQGSPRILYGLSILLQEIVPTQESNRALLHCRRILYQLSHQGSSLYTLSSKFLCTNSPIKAVYKFLTHNTVRRNATSEFATRQKMFIEWNLMC